LAGLAVLLAAIVVPLVFFGGPSQSPAGSEPASPSPAAAIPRTSFQFDAVSVRISALGGPQAFGASHDAGENIRTSLSRFYDQAFVDPATWAKGVPTSAWNIFSPSVRGRAEQDATSLALGTQVPGLAQLFVSQASLSVRVLVDPRGHIQLSAADVQFGATGELQDGRFVVVMNRASFLFKSESGRWMIVGYPIASIDLLGGPSASPAPSSSVSPTPTASGATP
jgi:hypothetical protein